MMRVTRSDCKAAVNAVMCFELNNYKGFLYAARAYTQ